MMPTVGTSFDHGLTSTGQPPVDPQPSTNTSRQGPALGKCFGSEFRECRGGDALLKPSYTHQKLDQFDRAGFRGAEGQGQCMGMVREAMRRIDLNTDGDGDVPTTLSSAIRGMDIDTRNNLAPDMYARIRNFQDYPANLGMRNYHQSSNTVFAADASRTDRIDGTIRRLSELPPGGMAEIRLGITQTGVMGAPTNGHALLVQRMPANAPGIARYALFDPNNGAFTYTGMNDGERALRGYLERAFSEGDMVVAPDRVTVYVPNAPRVQYPSSSTAASNDPLLPEPNFLIPPLDGGGSHA